MSGPGSLLILSRRILVVAVTTTLSILGVPCSADAALEVTEVMFNPLDENIWEWVEVRNTDPNLAVDLNGAYVHSLGSPRLLAGTLPHIDNALAGNTVIPAGGVAVLYDGVFPGAPSDPNANPNLRDQVFRDAWQLGSAPALNLIAVDGFPQLANTGSSIGVWKNFSDYEADLVDPGSGNLEVGSFGNTQFGLDFRQAFPTPPDGGSMRWNRMGAYQQGIHWAASVAGSVGAHTSMPSFTGGQNLNSTTDVGNPGFVPAGGAVASLIISEVMVSPDSPEPEWEWVEVFNNTGAEIDFSLMPYVFDDDDGDDLTAANITTGSIGIGGIGVLYNADALTMDNMIDAWDPGGVNGTNFIPVSNFSEMDPEVDIADSETIALWSSLANYQLDSTPGPGRDFDNTATVLVIEDGGFGGWPGLNGFSSLFLNNLNEDQNDGFNWRLSNASDPNADPNSFNASQATGGVVVYNGGDVGSPGVAPSAPINDPDFNDDNLVDGFDFLAWQLGVGVGTTHAEGDSNLDQRVDDADLAVWESQYGLAYVSDADFNDDNVVDGLDFLVWQLGAGVGTTHAQGDANGDGVVNQLDLTIWEFQFGQVLPLQVAVAVPEPTGLALLATLSLLCWGRRGRRCSL